MRTDTPDTDIPTVDEFLAATGYTSAEEWAADSDYRQDANGDWLDEYGNYVQIDAQIENVIETLASAGELDEHMGRTS